MASGRFLESRASILSARQAGLLRQGLQHVGSDRLLQLRRRNLLVGPGRDPGASLTSPWPRCLKASVSSRRPPLSTSPMLAPPRIPPRFPALLLPRRPGRLAPVRQDRVAPRREASRQSCPGSGTPRWRGAPAALSWRDIRGSYHHPRCPVRCVNSEGAKAPASGKSGGKCWASPTTRREASRSGRHRMGSAGRCPAGSSSVARGQRASSLIPDGPGRRGFGGSRFRAARSAWRSSARRSRRSWVITSSAICFRRLRVGRRGFPAATLRAFGRLFAVRARLVFFMRNGSLRPTSPHRVSPRWREPVARKAICPEELGGYVSQ